MPSLKSTVNAPRRRSASGTKPAKTGKRSPNKTETPLQRFESSVIVTIAGQPFRLEVVTEARNRIAATVAAEESVDTLLSAHCEQVQRHAARDIGKFMADFWGFPNPEGMADSFFAIITNPEGARAKLNAGLMKAVQHLTGGAN